MASIKRIIFRLSRIKHKPEKVSSKEEELTGALKSALLLGEPVQVVARDPSYRVIESYYVHKPFVKVTIAETDEGPMYFVEEYGLTPEDKEVLEKLTNILMDEIRPPTKPEDVKDLKGYVFRETERIVEKYRTKLGLVGARRLKLLYYVERNLLGYGPIDPLMKDPNIEDISCNGVGIPIYVWHRKYESIPTNITFVDEDYLNEYVMKLTHMAGKHVSIAFPIVDAMLPEKHRLAATFGREVSVKGPTFTIRKFREKPFSVTELIKSGTINSLLAAYLWTMIEHMKTAMIAGGTGTGKSFPGDTQLIVKINDTPMLVQASKLYDMIKSDEYMIDGHIVKNVNDKLYVLSIDKDYKLKWMKVNKVIKHRDNRPLVKVVTETSIITTTVDHNFIKIDPETLELVPVKASELAPGDYIVNTWLDIEYNGHISISPEYAYFIGLWSGDGYLESNSNVIGFTSRDEDLIDKMVGIIGKLFKARAYISVDKRNGVKIVRFRDNSLYNKLRDLYDDKKSDSLRVPYEIMFSKDKTVILAYLTGLLESDGSIYLKSTREHSVELIVEYSSRSKELINGVSFLLKRLRIRHVIQVKNVKSKPYYILRIYGNEASKFLLYIRDYLISSSKKKIVETALKLYEKIPRNPNNDVYPVFEYVKKIREKLGIGKKTVEKELGLPSRYLRQYEYGRRKPGREVLVKFTEYYSSKAEEVGDHEVIKAIQKLNKLIEGDIYFEKVKRIEKIEPTKEYLYDLEVEGTHNFVIGQIGWRLNHNTTLLNVISLFIKPGMKIVTVEDTPELNLPHDNWVQLTTRETYLVGSREAGTNIRLFDLVKLSLRYRPDYIIVGEVRGEEAFVLFQALASVSYDTPILIKDDNGNTELVKIGEFVDKFYREGEERIAKPVNGYYVLSNDGFNVVWKPIKYVLRHSVNEIYEIEYQGGGKVEATGSHSVFVLDPDTLNIVEKPVTLLREGDLVISFKGVKDKNTKYQTIDLISLLKDQREIYVDGISEEMKIYTGGKNPIPLQQYIVLKQTYNVEGETEKLRLRRSKYTLPAKLVFDEKLAYVFGVYLADGCVKTHKSKRICFTFGDDEKEIAEKTIRIMYEKFGLKPVIDKRETYTIYEYPHTLLAIVFEKLLGRKLREKKIPYILWNSPRSVVKAFFEGLKADSRRTLKRRYTSYTTANKELAYQLLWLARYHGFYSELVIEKGTGRNNGKTYYNVLVYLDEGYKIPNASEKIPVKPLLRLIKFTKPKSMPYELTYITKREFISRKTAEKLLEWIKRKGEFTDFSREYMRRIEELINRNIIVLKVKRIRKKNYNGYVYDLSVPSTESFFGGPIPILLHNTGHGGLCLPRDQLVLASVNGHIDLYEIGKLVEDVIENKIKDLRILTYSNGKPIWVPVSRVVVKNGSRRFIRIYLEGGVVHEVHENHPVIIFENGKLTTKPAYKLKKGDLLVSLKSPAIVDEKVEEINAIKLLEKYSDKLYVENVNHVIKTFKKRDIYKAANKIGRSIKDVDDWYYGRAAIPYKLFVELGVGLEKLVSGRVKFGEKGRRSIPMRIKLDRDFGYILGFFLADGTIQYDNKDGLPRRIILYPGKDKRLADKIITKLRKIGLDKESIYIMKTKNDYLHINVDSKAFALLINEILKGKLNDYNRSVPLDLALRGPEDFRKGIIEGYWDGDGSIIIDKNNHIRLTAQTVNRKLAESIVVVLRSLGILASLRIVDNTRGFAEKPSTIYVITVVGGDSKAKMLEILGKQELLKRKTYTRIKKYDGLYIHRVTRTEIIEKDSLLYDIEVPGTHMFAISGGLVLTHNSTIHAETLDYAIKRLTSPPMNIPPAYMKLMNMFLHLSRVITRVERGIVRVRRRVTIVQEVVDEGKYVTIAKWNPREDTFEVNLNDSYHLKDIAEKRGWDFEDVIEEIYRKATVLNWMIYKNIFDVWDVSRIIFNYYLDPQSVYRRAVEELEKAEKGLEEVTREKPAEAVVVEETGETKELGEATRELFERTRELGR